MLKKVLRKQNNSKFCLVCGLENKAGLHTFFYELEGNQLAGLVTIQFEHQSYPGRVHGGITAALLDETIGRAVNITEPDTWGVTVELSVRYKKPVPYDVPLLVIGEVCDNKRLTYTGKGAIILPDGEVAATGTAKYMKMPLSSIADFDAAGDSWEVVLDESDPGEILVPDAIRF